MANLQHLENGAAKATGDKILAAGLFQPKGMAGKQVAGAVAGSVLGDSVGGDVASDVGASPGIAIATAASKKDGSIRFVLAISATKTYVLKPTTVDSLHKEELDLLQTFDRATAHITVHGRVSVRTIVIENPETGDKAERRGIGSGSSIGRPWSTPCWTTSSRRTNPSWTTQPLGSRPGWRHPEAGEALVALEASIQRTSGRRSAWLAMAGEPRMNDSSRGPRRP
jgi:hypothetical protein